MDWTTLEQNLRARTPGLMDATGKYAVLVPLVEGEEGPALLYEVRAGSLRRQPGEVCFPGGKMEGSESPEECALRETWEELGIPPKSIQVLGRLDFIAHRANFIMWPVLGLVEEETLDAFLRPSPAEVEEIFRIPLSHLMDTVPLEYDYRLLPQPGEEFPYELIGIPRDYHWQPGRENVPVYPWKDHAVWGLTARITRHLVSLLKELGEGELEIRNEE